MTNLVIFHIYKHYFITNICIKTTQHKIYHHIIQHIQIQMYKHYSKQINYLKQVPYPLKNGKPRIKLQ
jgi:hypothetical protein